MNDFFNNLKEELRLALSVSWLTFGLIFASYWIGLATVTWGWFCLPYLLWFFLWIWFADKPIKS